LVACRRVNNQIKIIDLFAGPGGLAEGFSSYQPKDRNCGFEIALSVEKEFSAWKTLRLRAFTRQFSGKLPPEYYEYIAGNLGKDPEELYRKYPEEAENANKEAKQFTLGEDCGQTLSDDIKRQLEGTTQTVLIGGPPCQAFSLVGRARNKGIKDYNAEEDHRHFLYQEYLKILKEFKPSVFVMENVKGILSSRIKNKLIFHEILNDMEEAGYQVYSLVKHNNTDARPDPHDFIIQAEQYGIPQARHRVIILGVRKDIKNIPEILQPTERVSVEQVIGGLPARRSGLSKHSKENTSKKWAEIIQQKITPAHRQLGDKALANKIRQALGKISGNTLSQDSRGPSEIASSWNNMPSSMVNWYRDKNMHGICNHDTRGHMDSDLARYLFCSCYAEVNKHPNMRMSPKLNDFPDNLLPDHKNAKSGKFVDRFKVQERHLPASTITSHISKDGHYFIHYDPAQCRSLTVREAARIQTFPDNYFFEGNRTEQYVQVGNAVPPFLAKQIAKIVYSIFEAD